MQTSDLKIKIFADGANLEGIKSAIQNPLVSGFTTNPTLMKASGIKDYKSFAFDALKIVENLPISFEVFSDDLDEMYEQAKEIGSWGKNVNVKIPITNTKGHSCKELVKTLNSENIICNVTAMFTKKHLEDIVSVCNQDQKIILSFFAGRIADTGIDPLPFMKDTVEYVNNNKNISILWASPREVLNVVHADQVGCQIITVTNDLLNKLNSFGKDLNQFSLETVQMFYNDALVSGFKI